MQGDAPGDEAPKRRQKQGRRKASRPPRSSASSRLAAELPHLPPASGEEPASAPLSATGAMQAATGAALPPTPAEVVLTSPAVGATPPGDDTVSTEGQKSTRTGRGRKKPAAKAPTPALPPDPADEMEGPGRRPKLTRKLLDQLCEDLATGVAQEVALLALHVTRETKRRWLLRADEDEAAGLDSLYVEFRDRVKPAAAKGQVEYFRALKKGAETGNRKDVEKAKVAERAIRLRWGRRYLQHERDERQKGGGGTSSTANTLTATATTAEADLSRLSDDEFDELQKAHATVQRLMAKARGQELQAKA